MKTLVATSVEYQRIFDAERTQVYQAVSELEDRMGCAILDDRLLDAARVLACPLKDNPPNWQHGRVLYAVARNYFAHHLSSEPFRMLDIGTAKGFSALCVEWARRDAGVAGAVYSVDVLDPDARVRRNTVAEVDGFKTLHETLAPWPEALSIHFEQSTGIDWLKRSTLPRVHLAFVDGKHTGEAVSIEAQLLAAKQQPGDVVVFDDAQIPGVAMAIESAQKSYVLEHLTIKPGRTYVIARRR